MAKVESTVEVALPPEEAWAKAALVASQITTPSRSAAIQSASGTRTPEVVPFQVNTTS